jgi:hypothetical protein
MRNCGRCHTCGTVLRVVLDGEEWCPYCQTYRRYRAHGWATMSDVGCCPIFTPYPQAADRRVLGHTEKP